MSPKVQSYVQAILSNPEWIKSVAAKHNAVVTTDQGQIVCRLTADQIASEAFSLETALSAIESKRN